MARTAERDPDGAAAVRETLRCGASGALVVGLRRGIPGAARFLAVYAALHADAHKAAREAALLELRHAHLTGVPDVALVSQRQEAWLGYLWTT